jgi:hypothetical protein
LLIALSIFELIWTVLEQVFDPEPPDRTDRTEKRR